MSTILRLVRKKGKQYAMFECEYCKRDNYLPLDLFMMAYKNSNGEIYCKYCGAKAEFHHVDPALERRLSKLRK